MCYRDARQESLYNHLLFFYGRNRVNSFFFLWDTYLVTSCMLHSERQTDLFENYKQRMAEKTAIETQLKNLTIQVSSEPQK